MYVLSVWKYILMDICLYKYVLLLYRFGNNILDNGIGKSKENLLEWFSRSHEVIAGSR